MNWIDTNTLIAICTCAIGLTQFILWKHIAKAKAYEAEKGKNTADKEDSQEIAMLTELGKNIATKKDIQDITNKVESIKASYNESLERHKIELQKEFENTKYIINLCNSIDNRLIELINEALQASIDSKNETNLQYIAEEIANFLHIHQARYGGNEILDNLKNITLEIKKMHESDYFNYISYDGKKLFLTTLNNAASLFLPKFN